MGTKRSRLEYIIATLNRFPLVIVAFSLLITFAALETGFRELQYALAGICGLFLIRTGSPKICVLVLLGLLLGIFQYNRFTNLPQNHLQNFLGKEVLIRGVATAAPVSSGSMQKVVVMLLTYFENNEWRDFNGGKVSISINKYLYEINKADTLEFRTELQAPEKIEEFDYAAYLLTEDIYAIGKNPQNIRVISTSNTFLDTLRERVITEARQTFPEPHASLLLGILLGTREDIPARFNLDLKATGTSHVIAVSGYNVTVLATVCLSISGLLPRRVVAVMTIVMLFLFLLLVGVTNIPALRAVLTGCAVIAGSLTGRKGAAFNLLALACIIVILINPFSYKSISFQLSFAAVLGLMLIQSRLQTLKPKFFNKEFFAEFSTSLAANLATFPVIFSNFGTLTIWSPVVNVIIAPLVPMIMFSGAIFAAASLVNNSIADLLAIPVWFLLELLIRLIGFGAHLPLALISFSQNRVQLAALILVLICLWIFEINYHEYKLKYA